MKNLAYSVGSGLLEIQALKFNFKEPYVWASGIKSPIYCDNRLTLSEPSLRSIIRDAYVEIIKDKFPNAEAIAGVATGALAQGALVADKLNLPFVYIRENRKKHGLKKIIEGKLDEGQKTVIIEDLVSTGGSSLRALDELRDIKADVLGMIATFSYGFQDAIDRFIEKNCELYLITTFQMVKDIALEKKYISEEELLHLEDWHRKSRVLL